MSHDHPKWWEVALACAILVAVGVALFSAIPPRAPQGPFIIVKKDIITIRTNLIFTYEVYAFYYDHQHWIEVTQRDYDHYDVGDLYPNDYVILHQVAVP